MLFKLMTKLILAFLIVSGCALHASRSAYPVLYGSIGDKVYRAAEGYGELLKLDYFKKHEALLKGYMQKAETARNEGTSLDQDSSDRERRIAYIAMLRNLDKERKAVDERILHEIDYLGGSYNITILGVLKTNPYEAVSQRVKRYLNKPVVENGELPPIDLQSSLALLKERLMQSRSSGDAKMQCLNDITAVNYWMLHAEQSRYRHDSCGALEAMKQVSGFEASARKSCGDQEP
ncbi:MAG: hypothetical protein R3302_09535, partial [Sulfurimonadaceae bacterium]|nr:hypothetical protein [Sulfurimonadaceae bacterium]